MKSDNHHSPIGYTNIVTNSPSSIPRFIRKHSNYAILSMLSSRKSAVTIGISILLITTLLWPFPTGSAFFVSITYADEDPNQAWDYHNIKLEIDYDCVSGNQGTSLTWSWYVAGVTSTQSYTEAVTCGYGKYQNHYIGTQPAGTLYWRASLTTTHSSGGFDWDTDTIAWQTHTIRSSGTSPTILSVDRQYTTGITAVANTITVTSSDPENDHTGQLQYKYRICDTQGCSYSGTSYYTMSKSGTTFTKAIPSSYHVWARHIYYRVKLIDPLKSDVYSSWFNYYVHDEFIDPVLNAATRDTTLYSGSNYVYSGAAEDLHSGLDYINIETQWQSPDSSWVHLSWTSSTITSNSGQCSSGFDYCYSASIPHSTFTADDYYRFRARAVDNEGNDVYLGWEYYWAVDNELPTDNGAPVLLDEINNAGPSTWSIILQDNVDIWDAKLQYYTAGNPGVWIDSNPMIHQGSNVYEGILHAFDPGDQVAVRVAYRDLANSWQYSPSTYYITSVDRLAPTITTYSTWYDTSGQFVFHITDKSELGLCSMYYTLHYEYTDASGNWVNAQSVNFQDNAQGDYTCAPLYFGAEIPNLREVRYWVETEDSNLNSLRYPSSGYEFEGVKQYVDPDVDHLEMDARFIPGNDTSIDIYFDSSSPVDYALLSTDPLLTIHLHAMIYPEVLNMDTANYEQYCHYDPYDPPFYRYVPYNITLDDPQHPTDQDSPRQFCADYASTSPDLIIPHTDHLEVIWYRVNSHRVINWESSALTLDVIYNGALVMDNGYIEEMDSLDRTAPTSYIADPHAPLYNNQFDSASTTFIKAFFGSGPDGSQHTQFVYNDSETITAYFEWKYYDKYNELSGMTEEAKWTSWMPVFVGTYNRTGNYDDPSNTDDNNNAEFEGNYTIPTLQYQTIVRIRTYIEDQYGNRQYGEVVEFEITTDATPPSLNTITWISHNNVDPLLYEITAHDNGTGISEIRAMYSPMQHMYAIDGTHYASLPDEVVVVDPILDFLNHTGYEYAGYYQKYVTSSRVFDFATMVTFTLQLTDAQGNPANFLITGQNYSQFIIDTETPDVTQSYFLYEPINTAPVKIFAQGDASWMYGSEPINGLTLEYTTDLQGAWSPASMTLVRDGVAGAYQNNMIMESIGEIPVYVAGTTVYYRWEVIDNAGNIGYYNGSYIVGDDVSTIIEHVSTEIGNSLELTNLSFNLFDYFSGIRNVSITYIVDGLDETTLEVINFDTMVNELLGLQVTLPAFELGSEIEYTLKAVDNDDNIAYYSNSFRVTEAADPIVTMSFRDMYALGEAELLTLNGTSKYVPFSINYDNPAIFATIVYNENLTPSGTNKSAYPVIYGVNTTGFWIYLSEDNTGVDNDGVEEFYAVSYLVMESGTHYIDGRWVEVGSLKSNGTWVTHNFIEEFVSTPTVLLATQTMNNNMTLRQRSQSLDNVSISIQIEAEGLMEPNLAVNETVAFIAIGQGSSSLFETGNLTTSEQFSTTGLTNSYFSTPVVLASINSQHDSSPVFAALNNLTTTNVSIFSNEINFEDGIHSPEHISYLALSQGLIFGSVKANESFFLDVNVQSNAIIVDATVEYSTNGGSTWTSLSLVSPNPYDPNYFAMSWDALLTQEDLDIRVTITDEHAQSVQQTITLTATWRS